MPRGTLVVDEKLLRDHFMRQQRGGNITGYRGARFQRGYGIEGIFKSLARYAIPLFKQGAKVVGKRALQAATDVGQDAWAYRAGGGRRGRRGRQPPSLLGKQSQSGNIRFTVGQYWLIIKINGTNSVNFVGNSVNFVGNMLSNRNFS